MLLETYNCPQAQCKHTDVLAISQEAITCYVWNAQICWDQVFKALAVVYHSNFWLYLNKLALQDHVFEGPLVTPGLGLLVRIHTEGRAANQCGHSTVLLFGTKEDFIRKLCFVLGRGFFWLLVWVKDFYSSSCKPLSLSISPLQAEDS